MTDQEVIRRLIQITETIITFSKPDDFFWDADGKWTVMGAEHYERRDQVIAELNEIKAQYAPDQ